MLRESELFDLRAAVLGCRGAGLLVHVWANVISRTSDIQISVCFVSELRF